MKLCFRGGRTYSLINRGSGPIWMDGMHCDGSEAKINDCSFNGWSEHNCTHRDDAGVYCTECKCITYEP